ncbi:MAG: tetratricopeptide repeat protein [Acidobacteriota bacterium]
MRLTPALLSLVVASHVAAQDAGRLALARTATAKGEKLLAKEKLTDAEKAFRDAIANEPTYPGAHVGLGAALVGQQRYAEAVTALEQAKDRFIAWEQKSRETELQARQDTAQRTREFKDLQRQQQQKAPASPAQAGPAQSLTTLAATRVATEDYLAKRGWQEEAFSAIPPQVFYLEGLAYLRTGQRENGVAELTLCLALDPAHALAHYNLAVALFTGGQVLDAKEHLDAAVAGGVKPNPKFAADLEKAVRLQAPPTT